MSIYSDIKSLKIQGANEVAIAVLKHLRKFSKSKGFGHSFKKECDKFLKLRPTAVVLYNSLSEIKQDPSEEKISQIIKKIEEGRKKIPKNALKIFKKNTKVMTHCHSGVAVSAIINAKQHKKNPTVYVTETRPNEQGVITAKELSKKKVKTRFIIDSAAGYYMNDVDAVIVGADALRKEGIVNKIGTVMMAIAASELQKPFYVLASKMKVDKRDKIQIEKRDPKEIYKPIKGVKFLDPIFDVTPWKYVSAVVTEDGIKKPRNILKFIRGV